LDFRQGLMGLLARPDPEQDIVADIRTDEVECGTNGFERRVNYYVFNYTNNVKRLSIKPDCLSHRFLESYVIGGSLIDNHSKRITDKFLIEIPALRNLPANRLAVVVRNTNVCEIRGEIRIFAVPVNCTA
jgi:hypothetical protein